MKYTLLGHSGLRVSTVCLGTMGFVQGSGEGKAAWCSSKEESEAIVKAFLDGGGNIIDTSNSYGESEQWLGECLAPIRNEVVISTKYGGSNTPTDINGIGANRKSLMRSVERSLSRLKSDHIGVLSVQCWDFLTPVDEVMRALDDLIASGKVLYVGVSNAPAWIVASANVAAQIRCQSRFCALQVEYNLIERDIERELLPMAVALGIGVMAWTPLASGWLTGKYLDQAQGGNAPRRLDDPAMGRFVSRSERNSKIAAEVRRIAAEIERPPAQVALNWLRQNGVIPIVGARNHAQIRDNLRCTEFDLEQRHIDELTKVGQIPLGYPHAFLNSGIVKKFIYGEPRYSIVAPRGWNQMH